MTRAFWLALVTVGLVAASLRSDAAPADSGPSDAPLPVYRKVPPFSYPDQDGHPTTDVQLLGHPWIANFIFTRCTTACPILSARMVMLQRKISDPSVRFVSISVDPAHDTPAVLKAYAARWKVGETRWKLLSTDRQTLPTFAALLGITAEETGDPTDPIIHSDGFLLIDAAGFVRGAYRSTDEGQLKQLLTDLLLLPRDATPAPRPPAPTELVNGRELFVALGCPGCHTDPKLGSPLGGLVGSTVRLSDGKTIKVDEAYLRESILDPGAKRREGYPASMPSYAAQLGEWQLRALIDYVKTLPATAAAPVRQLSIDPVCKMEVSAGADTPHVEHRGKTYWFCSDECRQKFTKTPQHYIAP